MAVVVVVCCSSCALDDDLIYPNTTLSLPRLPDPNPKPDHIPQLWFMRASSSRKHQEEKERIPWHSKHAILESYAINSNAPYSDSRYIKLLLHRGRSRSDTAYYIGKTVTAPTVYTESYQVYKSVRRLRITLSV